MYADIDMYILHRLEKKIKKKKYFILATYRENSTLSWFKDHSFNDISVTRLMISVVYHLLKTNPNGSKQKTT